MAQQHHHIVFQSILRQTATTTTTTIRRITTRSILFSQQQQRKRSSHSQHDSIKCYNNGRAFSRQFTNTILEPSWIITKKKEEKPILPPQVTLYQYQICPFCNKVKAFLDYAKIDYNTVEVNPLTRRELKSVSKDYTKVPVALVDNQQINGSDEIVNQLLTHPAVEEYLRMNKWETPEELLDYTQKYHQVRRRLEVEKNSAKLGVKVDMKVDEITDHWGNTGGDDRESSSSSSIMLLPPEVRFRSNSSLIWYDWADRTLAVLLYPNICSTLGDSYRSFGYVDRVDSFNMLQKVMIKNIGAVAMYFAASRTKKKHQIVDEAEELHRALLQWETQGLKYFDSNSSSIMTPPTMGELSVYGVLRSIKDFPIFDEFVKGKNLEWYTALDEEVRGA